MTELNNISLIVRRVFTSLAMMAAVCGVISCSQTTAPIESNQTMTVSREFEFEIIDSTRMIAVDTVDAQLNATFNAVKDKITRVGCTSPIMTVTGFSGNNGAVIDTFYLYVGAQTSMTTIDTLTGPTFLTSSQLVGAVPQVLWVNNPALWQAQNLLGHAPYGFVLRAYLHSTRPVSRVRIRVDFPLDVNYLN